MFNDDNRLGHDSDSTTNITQSSKSFSEAIEKIIIPEALRYGIDIRDVRHYTVNDLLLMIRARAEQEQQQAWQVGARVLEAIGVAFSSKHKKYSDLPKVLENKESEEQKELNGLVEYLSRFNKH